MPDTFGGNVVADNFHFTLIDFFYGDAPVIDITLDEKSVFVHIQGAGSEPRTGKQDHGHAVCFILHDRIGRKSGGDNNSLNIACAGDQFFGSFDK